MLYQITIIIHEFAINCYPLYSHYCPVLSISVFIINIDYHEYQIIYPFLSTIAIHCY